MDDTSRMNRAFTGLLLREARRDAREAGVVLPKLSTWCSRLGTNTYYEVYGGKDEGMIWAGQAQDANEAKSQAIESILARGAH